jgi:hypothetical protein
LQGVILRVEPPSTPGGFTQAIVQMTDFLVPGTKTKKVKLSLPVEQVLAHIIHNRGELVQLFRCALQSIFLTGRV